MRTLFGPRSLATFGVRSLCFIAPLILAASCAPFYSHGPASKSATSTSQAPEGFSYYLPKRFARVVFERFEVEKEADKKLKEKTAELKKATDLLTEAKQQAADAKTLRDKLMGVPVPPQAELNKAIAGLAAAEIAQAAAERAVTSATEAVTKAQSALEAAKLGEKLCGFADRFSISLLPPVADPNRRYIVESLHTWMRTDELSFKTTKSGLLNNVTSKVSDQTGEILVNLASGRAAVRSVAGAPAVPGVQRVAPQVADQAPHPCLDPKTRAPRVIPLKVEEVLDPTDAAALDHFARHVTAKAQVPAIAGPVPLPALFEDTYELTTKSLFVGNKPTLIGTRGDTAAGLVYRRELPVLTNVFSYAASAPVASTPPAPPSLRCDKTPRPLDCALMGAWMLEVPNESPLEVLPAKASLFVESRMKFEFDNGMLLSHDSNRPSEIGRVAALPVEYAMSILEIPAKIIQLKVDLRSKQSALTSGDTELINAEVARIKAQIELEATRKAAEREIDQTGDPTL